MVAESDRSSPARRRDTTPLAPPMRPLLFLVSVLFLLAFALSGCARKASGLPEEPKGFSWYTAKNGAGSYLLPKGWHVKEATAGSADLLYLTREKITHDNGYFAGLKVRREKGVTARYGVSPAEYAETFIAEVIGNAEVLRSAVVEGGPTPMYVARIAEQREAVGRVIVHYSVIGVDSRDMVFLISFEAPAIEWNMLEDTARELLGQFILD